MSSWYGAARTNYVAVVDREAIEEAAETFGLKVFWDDAGRACLCPNDFSEDGGWPSFVEVELPDPDDPEGVILDDVEFDFVEHIMPHVEVGEVLVVMEAGHEKLRYITGVAIAFMRRPDGTVKQTRVSLSDIYLKAATEFETKGAISPAEY